MARRFVAATALALSLSVAAGVTVEFFDFTTAVCYALGITPDSIWWPIFGCSTGNSPNGN